MSSKDLPVGTGAAVGLFGESERSLVWTLARKGEILVVHFSGEVDENAGLERLRPHLEGRVVFDLEAVRRMNSAGVREWVNFVRNLPQVSELVFERCSPTIVSQLNMIYNFRGPARVRSFYAPYICEHCDVDVDVLLDVDTHFPDRDPAKVPPFQCPKCGRPLTFDDIPERYFAFVVQL